MRRRCRHCQGVMTVSLLTAILPERVYRWNFTVMGLDLALFSFGLSFASAYGILPLFVHHLTTSNLALGLIPAVQSAAGLIPPLFTATYTERLRLKKPFIVFWTIFERLPFLVLAIIVPLLASSHPDAMLWLFFILIGSSAFFGGVGYGAWLDLIARMLPPDWRGRFFGHFIALAGLLSVAGSAAASGMLASFRWPNGFAVCFATTFLCLIVSFVFLSLGREPTASPVELRQRHTERHNYWLRLLALLRDDHNFRRYILANGLLTAAGLATAFYTISAKSSFHLSDATAGLYAVILLASTTIGNVLWGYIGDRHGHKRVIEGGAVLSSLAALLALALAAGDPAWGEIGYTGVFLLVGFGSSGLQLASFTFATDFAPNDQRPTYIGLATTARAPFAIGAPLVGGLIADRAGYPATFALTAVLAMTGVLIMVFAVRDPRMNPLEQAAGEKSFSA